MRKVRTTKRMPVFYSILPQNAIRFLDISVQDYEKTERIPEKFLGFWGLCYICRNAAGGFREERPRT